MRFNAPLFFTALGLALVLEAMPWLLVPRRMRAALRELLEFSDSGLRTWGVVLLCLGVLLVALSR